MIMLIKEELYKQMKDMEDDKQPIIYENDEVREGVEIYIVIVRIASYGYRIYQSMKQTTGTITTKFMSIDNDMFNTMYKKK